LTTDVGTHRQAVGFLIGKSHLIVDRHAFYSLTWDDDRLVL
jgi:hypothetical protein